jgi:hypothetical protein
MCFALIYFHQQYSESIYSLNDGLDSASYNLYGFESTNSRGNANVNSSSSTALNHHNGSRYGLGLGGRTNAADSKMNGLHGPKHKRGDMDREYKRLCFSF